MWICHWTTSNSVYRPKFTFDLKNSNLALLTFKTNLTHPQSNQPKLNPVSESSTHPLQTQVCSFCSFLGQGAMITNQLPVIAPRLESQLSIVPLLDHCDIFQDGSLPFQHTHNHSRLHTNSKPSHSTS